MKARIEAPPARNRRRAKEKEEKALLDRSASGARHRHSHRTGDFEGKDEDGIDEGQQTRRWTGRQKAPPCPSQLGRHSTGIRDKGAETSTEAEEGPGYAGQCYRRSPGSATL